MAKIAFLVVVICIAAAIGYYLGYDIGFERALKNISQGEKPGNVAEKADLIRVSQPRPDEVIQSPLVVKGEARGFWFFEASFPVRLIDANGKNIPLDPPYIMATSEWMTENFVPFESTVSFEKPQTKTGTLILERDNPSGLPENDDSLIIPVKF